MPDRSDPSPPRLGWIGLGAMGGIMAANVAKAGYGLTVHDLRAEAMTPLTALGATTAQSAQEVAEASDILFVCLASEQASAAVMDAVLAAGHQPQIVVEHSTLTPDTMRSLGAKAAAAGISFLDAPVSGSKRARDAGELSVMIGGDEDAAERLRPIMTTFANRIFHLGPIGSGSVAKISHNLIALTGVLATIEGLLLGVRHGIPMDKLRDAVLAGAAGSPVVEHVANLYISRAYRGTEAPEAAMRLVIKDLTLAKELADACDLPIRTAESALASWQEAVDAGFGDTELFTMIDYLENGKAS